MNLNIINLGRMEYNEALAIQTDLWQKASSDQGQDTLLLVEHPPVITLGVRGQREHILLAEEERTRQGVSIEQVNRGGDVTYHGPGQVVGYPIMNLKRWGRDIHEYVQKIEQTFINLLMEDYGISAERGDKTYTGVWVGMEKIVAIGFQVKKWTTMHGFAFNVNTDLSHFKWIVPCGLSDRGVTSLEKLTGEKQDMDKLFRRTAQAFCESFGVNSST